MNYFDEFTWEKMLNSYPREAYDISSYHKILHPETPDFLQKYLSLPIMTRLKGIGLLCGTDWTPLYKNRFYYSRFDHSLGVALIVWHFTHDKAQTLAGLFHDVSTPLFSHVADFRKGDALTQEASEEPNAELIRGDKKLRDFLAEDGIELESVTNYHLYPIADNEIPQLSADRLEYMFPSGMSLDGSWTLDEISLVYNDLTVCKNENGIDELAFKTMQTAELYCRKFCMIGHILQLNENKLTLQLLAEIVNLAVQDGFLTEEDCIKISEEEAMQKFDKESLNHPGTRFALLYKTYRTMTKIEHTDKALPKNDYFCVSLNVKQRYINPLIITKSGDVKRLFDVSPASKAIINDFLSYNDTKFGCVILQKN